MKAKPPTKDRATAYAKAVVSGTIQAGPIVRGSCQRHLDDLKAGPERGLKWDIDGAAHGIDFFETVLKLNGGQFEGLPFLLLPWQAFVIGSIFGWKRKDGTRRFRVVYVEGPKGCGKSPLAAGVGLKGLLADNEPRAEIYAAATFKDQAMVLFRDAVAFYEQSPALTKRLVPSGVGPMRWNLTHLESASFFRVISSEKKGQSGPRPHMALLDEIHEHRDGSVIEMLRAGFKFRRQPLSFMITNSGHDKTSICWEYHELGRKIATGMEENDEFFAYICSLDDEDLINERYLEDETLWHKVNPSLDAGIPGIDYIRGQVKEARGLPSKMSTVKRLCFCVWTDADNPWIGSDVWLQCADHDFDDALLAGRRCWGGMDLSSVRDLTALVLLFEPTEDDPLWRIVPRFWIPKEGLRRKVETDNVPYDIWVQAGHLTATDGPAVSKGSVCLSIADDASRYDLQGIAYDRNRMADLLEVAEKEGIDLAVGKWDKEKREWDFGSQSGVKMLPFGQESRSMAPAMDKFETLLLNKAVRHNGNPVLTWNAANSIAVADENEYRKVSKRKSVGRVDGIVAAVMAAGVAEAGTVRVSAYAGMTKDQIKQRMAF